MFVKLNKTISVFAFAIAAATWTACGFAADVVPPMIDAELPAPSLTVTPATAMTGTARSIAASAVQGADGYVFVGGTSPGHYSIAYPLAQNSFSASVTEPSTLYLAVVATKNGAWSNYSNEVAVTTTAPPNATQSDADAVFNWAEQSYSAYFSPPGAPTQAIPNGFKRTYSKSASSLEVVGRHVIYNGELSGNKALDLGDFSSLPINGSPNSPSQCASPASYQILPPVNLENAQPTIWPHGVHGINGHPEGHPGMDFFFDKEQQVTSPIDGTVKSYDPSEAGDCVLIDTADSCIEIAMCFVRNPGLEVGTAVTKGQVVGKTAATTSGYMIHFGTRYNLRATETAEICPADLMDPEFVRCKLGKVAGQTDPTDCSLVPLRTGGTLLHGAKYPETVAHTIKIGCADGTSITVAAPSEPNICNSRAATDLKNKIQACLQYRDERMW